jgi:ABC-type antimicrobial peptide transport system permease subunit
LRWLDGQQSLELRRKRVVRQLLTECLVLAILAGGASLIVASRTLAAIASMLPVQTAASLRLGLQPPVIGFTALLAIATTLVFGIVPALHGTRDDLIRALREGGGHASGGRWSRRLRNGLATVE